MATLVFDIGGTTTRAGLFDVATSTLLRTRSAPTPNHLDFPRLPFHELSQMLFDRMDRLGSELVEACEVSEVGVAFAGPVAPSGEVLAAPTVWGTIDEPFALEGRLAPLWPRARIRVLNDVTAAGYRHVRRGGDFCIVTVSSGIGNKVFVGGRPLVGPSGLGGELGHLRVADAPACECGGIGHLGAIASGRGVLALARDEQARPALTAGDLVAAFHRRDSWAVSAIERGATPLGRAIAAVHLGVGIERFVLVGGFALALGERYRQLVARGAAVHCWTGGWPARLELGAHDDFAGLIGAGIATGGAA